jgi:HlyD family secretion protein
VKRWSARYFGYAAVGLLIVGFIVWAFLPGPVEADVASVTRGLLQVTVDHEGKTRVRERYVVSAPLTGRLARTHLHAGDAIQAGKTLLAVIEPRDPELLDVSARAQAEARVRAAEEELQKQSGPRQEEARSAYQKARTDLERSARLLQNRNISQEEYDVVVLRERTAAAALRAIEFAVRIAKFELDQARAALIRTRPASPGEQSDWLFEIRAPIDGRVLRIFQESAVVVTPGTRLLEVGDPIDLEVEVDVLSTDAVKVQQALQASPDVKVLLEHWGGRDPLKGRVRLVEPSGFTKISALGVEEQRVWVILDFTDPPARWQALGDGYRVDARIIIWEGRDVLQVPAGALFRHQDGWAVFVVQGGRARLRPVQVGATNGLQTQILDGLAEGESVIVHPSDRIQSDIAIMARNPNAR